MRRLAVAAVAVSVLLGLASSGCHKDEVTAPALSATCEAQPASGAAPLAVRFLVSVAGAEGPFTVEINYGDGSSGTDPDTPHTYAAPGSFTASFTITTATQSARCAAGVSVSPGSSPSPSPSPGANGPPHPVFKSTPDAVNGTITGRAPLAVRFNMCATTDPDGDMLWFSMDFDGDGNWDNVGTTGAHCRYDHVYAAGTYNKVTMCVHDVTPTYEGLHQDQCKLYTVVATP